ncbi:MAG: endonuclease [Rhodothermales bacterium]
MKLTATTLCLLVLPLTALAQSLAPGDLAVIGMNSDNPEAFAFVTLVDIPAGTEIKFTDNGWLAAGGFRGGEQTHTYTASTDLAAGTVVTITTDVPDFSNAGDQLLAYQGADDAPSFIYALNNKGGGLWQADATSSSTSALPPGLTDGVTAVALVEANNVVYSGTMRGSRAELLQGIGDRENWTRDNNAPQTFPAGPFDVTALTGGDYLPEFTSVLSAGSIPAEQRFSFMYEAVDGDGDPLTFSLLGPPGSGINPETGLFTWTPNAFQAGETFTVSVRVTDGTNEARTSTILSVTPPINQPPVFTDVLPDDLVDGGTPIAFTYAATDAEGETLTFALVNPPAGAVIDADTGAFSWTPSDVGVFPITVTVTDGTSTTTARSVVGVRGVFFPGETGAALRQQLRATYTPAQTLGSARARDTMYARVDLDAAGFVRGVYTGFAAALTSGDPSTVMTNAGINAEHTWPQSKGAGAEPATSDLHHLFPTRIEVNAERGNKPFADIPDDQTQMWFRLDQSQSGIPSANIDEYSESTGGAFEPREAHKGNAARAVLYFFTIYESVAERSFLSEYRQLDHLLAWEAQDPADVAEVVRTQRIAQVQGNINPFVVDPSLAQRVFADIVATEPEADVPDGFRLEPAYPNPFNPQTHLTLVVDRPRQVRVVVFDGLGRQVRVLHDGLIQEPTRRLTFDASALPSGVYYVRAVGETALPMQPVILLK